MTGAEGSEGSCEGGERRERVVERTGGEGRHCWSCRGSEVRGGESEGVIVIQMGFFG